MQRNAAFFYKAGKRMQRTFHSFYKERKRMRERFVLLEKNAKERKNIAFFWKEHMPNRVDQFRFFDNFKLLMWHVLRGGV